MAVALALVATWSGVARARALHYRWAVSIHAHKHSLVVRHDRLPRARAAVVGGSQIAISQAPWQVEILAKFKSGNGNSCGGAILDSTHVVTAAHCTFDLERGEPLPASALIVVGGTAHMSAEEIKNNPEVQARSVSEVRVHPMFEFSKGPGTSDDVAVLTLATPLSLDGSVGQIALSPTEPQEGASVRFTGFGEQSPGIGTELLPVLVGHDRVIPPTLRWGSRCSVHLRECAKRFWMHRRRGQHADGRRTGRPGRSARRYRGRLRQSLPAWSGKPVRQPARTRDKRLPRRL